MASNLGSSKIKNTYQKVVQVDPSPSGSSASSFYDLTGNRVSQVSFTGMTGSFSGDGSGITGVVSSSNAVTSSYADSVGPSVKCYNLAMTIALG